MKDLQTVILRTFISNDEYMRQVIPFIKPLYFDNAHRSIFQVICKYVTKYNKLPSKESFDIFYQAFSDNDEHRDLIDDVFEDVSYNDDDWLIDATEKWCQDKAIFNAVMKCVNIIDGRDLKDTKSSMPSILQDALSVGFDLNVGHDYVDNVEERYEYYHEEVNRVPFDLDIFNKITQGGVRTKTLTILMAGTGVGKSLAMCHMAANNLTEGKNVLYITMEMGEFSVGERIDANLLDVDIEKLSTLSKQKMFRKVNEIGKKGQGKLIVKEYPTAAAHVGHFRGLLNELKLKKKFEPDIIYIDYLNICASARIKMGGSINSYTYVKAIAEEIRGLAKEFDIPIISATQFNRSGFSSSDPGLDDTSESFGLPQTADYVLSFTSNDELAELGQYMVKQLKNRYGNPNLYKRFVIGVDYSRMRLFDVDEKQQTLIGQQQEDKPVFDQSEFGSRKKIESTDWNINNG